jgi:hypothetical protein
MRRNEKQEPTNQAVEVEDLPVDGARQDEVKGGDWVSHGHILTGNS